LVFIEVQWENLFSFHCEGRKREGRRKLKKARKTEIAEKGKERVTASSIIRSVAREVRAYLSFMPREGRKWGAEREPSLAVAEQKKKTSWPYFERGRVGSTRIREGGVDRGAY